MPQHDRIAKIIELLEQVQKRKAMYVGSPSASDTQTFLSGLDMGSAAHGLALSHRTRQQAAAERGWRPTAEVWPVSEMQERGLTDENVADEVLAIEILAWRLAAQGPA